MGEEAYGLLAGQLCQACGEGCHLRAGPGARRVLPSADRKTLPLEWPPGGEPPPQQREAGSLLVPHSPCSSTVLKASASNSSWVDTMAEFLRLVPSTWYPNTHKDGNRSPRV